MLVPGDGSQLVSLTHAADNAAMIAAALGNSKAVGQIFNCGTTNFITCVAAHAAAHGAAAEDVAAFAAAHAASDVASDAVCDAASDVVADAASDVAAHAASDDVAADATVGRGGAAAPYGRRRPSA